MSITKSRVHTFFPPPPVPPERQQQATGSIYYIKACNGAGKSTIPSYLASSDPSAYVIKYNGKVLLTVCPSYNFVLTGKYDKTKSKGVDSLNDKEQMMLAVELSEEGDLANYDLIFEGIIPSTILETWVERLSTRPIRKLVTLFIDTPLEECINRVKVRNGGAEFNEKLVADKFNRIKSHKERHNILFPNVNSGMIYSYGKTIEQMVDSFLKRDFGDI